MLEGEPSCKRDTPLKLLPNGLNKKISPLFSGMST